MTNYVYARDGGKTNEEGLNKLISSLFSGGAATVASATSLQVTQDTGSNMSMKVAIGVGQIPYSTYAFPVGTDAIATVTGAASDPSNPRNSILVAYVDLSVVSSASNNNPGALKYLVVNGTAAAVPVDPTDPTIQTAVGGTNPWIKLARAAITTGATAITNAMITDLRTSITSQFALGANSVTTTTITNASVTPDKWTNPYCFRAGASAATTLTNATAVKVNLANDSTSNCYDLNNNYSTANSQYTAPVTGIYNFAGNVQNSAATTLGGIFAAIYVNGTERMRGTFLKNTGVFAGANVSGDLTLTAGDLVELRGYVEGTGTIQTDASPAASWFSGSLKHKI